MKKQRACLLDLSPIRQGNFSDCFLGECFCILKAACPVPMTGDTSLSNSEGYSHHEVIHDLTLAYRTLKTQIFVMPAPIASIQARKDASANIHVNLDSSTPCWNDAIGDYLN